MSWFKEELRKEAFNWNEFLKGFGYGVAALGPLFMSQGISPNQAIQIIEQNNRNPQAIQRALTTQPSTQPSTRPATQRQFDYGGFRQTLEQHEGRRNQLYDDGTGVYTVGVGHAIGRDQSDPRAVRSRETFNKVFGPQNPWESLWNKGTLSDEQIDQLAEHDINEHLERARSRFPQFDTYPDYLQKALLDGIYRGDIGPKTQQLINAGQWQQAADEYINRQDYRDAEKKGMRGIRTRMDKNRAAMLQFAREQR